VIVAAAAMSAADIKSIDFFILKLLSYLLFRAR
jgi:hypothetical protein